MDDLDVALLRARAMVLHDVQARIGDADDVTELVDVVEDAVAARRWWVQQWPDGAGYVAGMVAQDVQDRLLETEGRWPTCAVHTDEPLELDPPVAADPWWVCEHGCGRVAPLGALPPA